jgi:hypothetical protein
MPPQIATPLFAKFSKVSLPCEMPDGTHSYIYCYQTLDAAFAWNIDAHIMGKNLIYACCLLGLHTYSRRI